jgi:uncharacterized protein (DUF486 family)
MGIESSIGSPKLHDPASRVGYRLFTDDNHTTMQDEIILVRSSKFINTFLSRESVAGLKVEA